MHYMSSIEHYELSVCGFILINWNKPNNQSKKGVLTITAVSKFESPVRLTLCGLQKSTNAPTSFSTESLCRLCWLLCGVDSTCSVRSINLQSGLFVYVFTLTGQANDWLMASRMDRRDIRLSVPLTEWRTVSLSGSATVFSLSKIFYYLVILSIVTVFLRTWRKRRKRFCEKLNCRGNQTVGVCQDEISFSFLAAASHHSLRNCELPQAAFCLC